MCVCVDVKLELGDSCSTEPIMQEDGGMQYHVEQRVCIVLRSAASQYEPHTHAHSCLPCFLLLGPNNYKPLVVNSKPSLGSKEKAHL